MRHTDSRFQPLARAASQQDFVPLHMGERQIAALFRGRRYEDETDLPLSDGLPLPRGFW